MADTFDAVLAKPPIPDTYSHTEVTLRNDKDTKWVRREDFDWHMKQQAARLAAAHAAEKSAWFLRAREEAERCGQAEARAEAAERDARQKATALQFMRDRFAPYMDDSDRVAIDAAIATPERAGRE